MNPAQLPEAPLQLSLGERSHPQGPLWKSASPRVHCMWLQPTVRRSFRWLPSGVTAGAWKTSADTRRGPDSDPTFSLRAGAEPPAEQASGLSLGCGVLALWVTGSLP